MLEVADGNAGQNRNCLQVANGSAKSNSARHAVAGAFCDPKQHQLANGDGIPDSSEV